MKEGLGILPPMKPVFLTLSLVATLLALNSCQTTPPPSETVGPFDADGNYVEALANSPSKWRNYKPKETDADPAAVAVSEQPPDHSSPIIALPPESTKPVVSSPRPKSDTPQVASRSTPTSRPRTSAATSTKAKTKPKPVVAKAKPKPKPASVVRYTVKSGDSLSSIASRNGTSVTALQNANGISGTMIHPGKSLVIPRRK